MILRIARFLDENSGNYYMVLQYSTNAEHEFDNQADWFCVPTVDISERPFDAEYIL